MTCVPLFLRRPAYRESRSSLTVERRSHCDVRRQTLATGIDSRRPGPARSKAQHFGSSPPQMPLTALSLPTVTKSAGPCSLEVLGSGLGFASTVQCFLFWEGSRELQGRDFAFRQQSLLRQWTPHWTPRALQQGSGADGVMAAAKAFSQHSHSILTALLGLSDLLDFVPGRRLGALITATTKPATQQFAWHSTDAECSTA